MINMYKTTNYHVLGLAHRESSCHHRQWWLTVSLREAIRKIKRLSFGHCVKGGGVQLESKCVEVVLFSPILTFFWTLICLNIGQLFEFWAYTKVTSRLSKMG